MVNHTDYRKEHVEAARSVLIELANLLGNRECIVLVGGWVPELILASPKHPHAGTTDVDLAFDIRAMAPGEDKTIIDTIRHNGYVPGTDEGVFYRKMKRGNLVFNVQVDLLADFCKGNNQEDQVRGFQRVRGCDLFFDSAVEVSIKGTLPEGAMTSAKIRVAALAPFIAAKGFALDDRKNSKDAYDIYYCISNYPHGLDAFVDEFRSFAGKRDVKEGLQKIKKYFTSVAASGPGLVADFEGIIEAEERERSRRDAYEKVNSLLTKLGIVS